MKTLAARSVLTFIGLDFLFSPLIIAQVVPTIGLQASFDAFAIVTLGTVLKLVCCCAFLVVKLKPYTSYELSSSETEKRELVPHADACLQSIPWVFGIFYACSWALAYGLSLGAVAGLLPSAGGNVGTVHALLLIVAGLGIGSFAFGLPIITLLTAKAAGDCSVFAREQGIALARSSASQQSSTMALAIALSVGPTIWLIAVGLVTQLDTHQAQVGLRSELEVLKLHTALVATPEEQWLPLVEKEVPKGADTAYAGLAVVDKKGKVLLGSLGTHQLLSDGALGARFSEKFADSREGDIAIPREGYGISYKGLDAGRAVVSIRQLSAGAAAGFMLNAGLFALLVALWAPMCAIALGRAISSPLQRLITATQQIVEQGTQSQMESLPVARNDEVGVLSVRFNDLIEMMRDLSEAADSIADGNLQVKVERKGELPNAFRRMVASLKEMVNQIRETSVELASATTEILAASQEQEAAAASQSSAMEEISCTMDSLSDSAAHVSDAVQGVLANAEKTLQNTDGMVVQIGQLSSLTGRIGEILDVIKEIADRSDILALNGSLEASRAGEGGQGFALVATEMRRLAERVTASVHDIKTLVSDIRESGSSTVMATEESKRLAEGTTEAARQITFVTQQQRSGTEQVSQSVKNIAGVVTQTVSASAQTRSSAESLKTQAEELSKLLRRFEVSEVSEISTSEAS